MEAEARQALILLVDDDVRSAQRLAKMLREDGYDVEVAADGARAIARLSQEPTPAILVTDLQLPHVDGRAVSRYARSVRSDMPVMVVTGYPQLAAEFSVTLDPPPEVFTKPLSYEDLTSALGRHIGVPLSNRASR